MTPYEIAIAAAKALDTKIGVDIKVLKVSDLTVIADYFVIASGSSTTQVKALADEVDFALTQQGVKPLHIEGKGEGGWMLIDFGSVIVHVFMEETRNYYSLERLWADAEVIPVEL